MLKSLKSTDLHRQRQAMTRHHRLVSLNSNDCINFADNDYLGLSQDIEVKNTFANAARQWGLGSGASALVCGHHALHKEFEQQFSEHIGAPNSLYLNSGYHANLAVFTCCSDRHSHIVADKHIHASLLDGIQLSRSKLHRYPHQSLEHANQLLQQHPQSVLVTESVFSMDGSISNLASLNALAEKHLAKLIVDDAHGFGVVKSNVSLCSRLLARITPLGKALGSCGAMISGSNELIESLVQHARSYRYTTALPPAIAAASIKALQLMQQQRWRHEKLQANIDYFHLCAKRNDIALLNTEQSAIKSIIVGNNQTCLNWQQSLTKHGIFVAAIRPPTVANHTARLRISLSCLHNKQQIDHLFAALRRLYNGQQ